MDDTKCQICKNVVQFPVVVCSNHNCGSLVCNTPCFKNFFDNWKGNDVLPKCPKCNIGDLSPEENFLNKVVKAKIEDLQFKSSQQPNTVYSYNDYISYLKSESNRLNIKRLCPRSVCKKNFTYYELEEHLNQNMCDCLTAECKLCQARLNEESTPPTSLNDHDCLIDAMLKEYEEMIINNPCVR